MKFLKIVAGGFGIMLLLFACKGNKLENSMPVNLLVDSLSSDGFGGDIHFSIIKTKAFDTSVVYTLQAVYKNKTVGFDVEVPKITNAANNGFGAGIVIRSVGEQSDNLRNALGEIYKIKIDTTKKFVKSADASYVDLIKFSKSVEIKTKDDPDYQKKLKLFLMSKEGEEAEIFFNINTENTIAEFPEKDVEYRKILLTLLTQL